VGLVEAGEIIEQGAPLGAVDAGRVVEVQHRVGARAEADPLVRGGEEAAAPEAGEDGLAGVLAGALRNQRDEGGKVGVDRAEAVADPSADAGVTGQLVTRVHEGDGGVVVDGLGVEALHDAELVGDALVVRQEVADPGATRAAAAAGAERGHDRVCGLVAGHPSEPLGALDGSRDLLPRVAVQGGLVVKQVDVREPAALEEAEHALGAGLEVGQAGPAAGGGGEGLGEQGAEGKATDPAGRAAKERAAGELMEQFGCGGVHRRTGLGGGGEGREGRDGGSG